MNTISAENSIAAAVVDAIQAGDLETLQRLLTTHPDLATCTIAAGDPNGSQRTLLHIVTDWPGHYPNGAQTVKVLVAAGSDVNARFVGAHRETPLHWAASCDDVAVLDALLDAGADIDAAGAVIGGGPPLADATAFKQWRAAHRLVERGARITLADAATLGLMDRVRAMVDAVPAPPQDVLDGAFWSACHGGQRDAAQYLLDRGADVNWWAPWEPMTPLDAAEEGEYGELVAWLKARGATSAAEGRR
ncbi:ankyrin repeat domain-containing protein [Lysobacter capsici]|uniref:ankyrin repeat domain-containing protein n=1 Tax=Lysobacter capsici TaxID=435897 RepID=UPI001BFFF0D4|nr:ankyrin repeat domain-containing protein [Lysobacter capsici]QWF16377.1 ankyrin repeat domain-containing protein [Lysobacter capsici]